jgi:hypothetical protein
MSQSFNLTAQINLQAPANLKTVVAQIRREFGSVSADVKVNISPQSARSIDNVKNRLDALNASLVQARNNTTSLDASLRGLAGSLSGIQSNFGKVESTVSKTSSSVAQTAKSIKVATTEMEEFGKQSALAIRRFAAFSLVTSGVFALINAVQSGFKAFIEFDKELVKLQQVTGKGAIGLQSLEKEITNLSTSLGVSSQSLMSVASTLAQAGLNAEDTRIALSALAKTELAPSFDNLTDTTEGAIAAIRQFGLDAKDLEKALGSINAVAAAFAVESKDIIAAIQRTGGVFAASSKGVSEGTDALNEFIAVFTSVRQTTRESAETIATGLRTIFTRLQRAKTIDQLKEYGVTLTDLEGKFVGPFEAVKRLSAALNQLDPRDLRFSSIVEELGGFRQIGKVIPLIQQFRVAQEALGVAQKGQGSLYEAQITAQKSLANQIAKVREQFLALIRDIGQSQSFQGLFKVVTGLASGLISLASAFKPILPILAIMGAVKGVSAIRQFGSGFIGGLSKGGGAKGVGTNVGETLSGAKEKEKEEVRQKANAIISENTSAIKTLTTTIAQLITSTNNLGSSINNRASGGSTFNTGGVVRKFARGGVVPGSGNGDTVPAMLEPGEFVMRKSAVRSIGADNLSRMNRYEDGGRISLSAKRLQERSKGSKAVIDLIRDDADKKFYFAGKAINTRDTISFKRLVYTLHEEDLVNDPSGFENAVAQRVKGNVTSISKSDPSFPIDVTSSSYGPLEVRNRKRSTSPATLLDKLIRYYIEEKKSNRLSNKPITDPIDLGQLGVVYNSAKYNPPNAIKLNTGGLIRKFATAGEVSVTGGQPASRSDILKVLGVAQASKIAGVSAAEIYTLLGKKNPNAVEQSMIEAVQKKYIQKTNRVAGASKGLSTRLQNQGLTFAAAGMFGKAFSPTNEKIESSLLSSSPTVRIVSGVLKPEVAKELNNIFNEGISKTTSRATEAVMKGYGTSDIVSEITPNINTDSSIQGGLLERVIQELGGPGASKGMGFDFPYGLKGAAKYFDVPQNIPTDLKRTITGPSIIKDNLVTYLKNVLGYTSGGVVQKFAIGGLSKAPLIDDILQASGAMLPKPSEAIQALIEAGGGALDVDRTLKRTLGDKAYSSAPSSNAKQAVLSKYFRDDQQRLEDMKSAPLTAFGKELISTIKSGRLNPKSLSIISKSQRTKGVPEYLHQIFGIPLENMVFTQGGDKQPALDAIRSKGPRVNRIGRTKFAEGSSVEQPELYTRGSLVYSVDDMKEAAKRKGITFDQLKTMLEERQDNAFQDFVIAPHEVSTKLGLTTYKPQNSAVYEKTMAAKFEKEDRIATWKQKQGIAVKDYEGRSERQKGFLEARKERRGFASGGFATSSAIYDLQNGTGLTNREFDQLVYYAKTNAFNEQEFKDYLSLHLQQKQAKKSLSTNIEELRRSLLPEHATTTPSQAALAQQLMGPPDAKYNPKYDNARKPFAAGGTVPALVSNGEAYVPPAMAKKIGYGKLNRMNQADRNGMSGFSNGGISVFKGPGTGTSDSIPTNLPVGSFIIREKATKALGLNKGGIAGGIQRFFRGGQPEKDVVRAQGRAIADVKDAEKTFAMIMGQLSKSIRDSIIQNFNGIKSVGPGGKIFSGATNFSEDTRGQAAFGTQKGVEVSAMGLQIGGKKVSATTETVAHETGHLADYALMGKQGFASDTEGTFQFELIKKIKPVMEKAFQDAGHSSKYIAKYLASNRELFAEFFAKASPEVRNILTSTTDAKDGMKALADHLGDAGYTFAGLEAVDIDPSRAKKSSSTGPKTMGGMSNILGSIVSTVSSVFRPKTSSTVPASGGPPPNRSPWPDDLMPLTTGVKSAEADRKQKEQEAYNDSQFFEYKARKEGITSGAFKLNVARRLGKAAYDVRDNFAGRKEEMGYELAGQQDKFTSLQSSLDSAGSDQEKDLIQARIKEEVEALANQMKMLKPSIKGADEAAKAMAKALMSGKLKEAQDKLKEALGDIPDEAEAMKIAMQQMSKELGISQEMLQRNFGKDNKDVKRQQFIQSREGQRFGALAEFAPDMLAGFSGSRAGRAVGGAADFISGKGGKFSQAFSRMGGLTAVGGGLSVAADQLQRNVTISDPTNAGIVGGVGGAGSGLASGSLLGGQIAGPVGAMIGGVTGALIGAINGAVNSFQTKKLENNLKALDKTTGELDAAFKKLESSSTDANRQQVQEKLNAKASAIANVAGQANLGAGGTARTITETLRAIDITGLTSALTGQQQEGEARDAVTNGLTQIVSDSDRLGASELNKVSSKSIGDFLSRNAAIADPAEKQLSMARANQSYQVMASSGMKENDIFLSKFIAQQKQQGKTSDQISAGLSDPKARQQAIQTGKELLAQEGELALKQALLARTAKDVAVATEQLLDVYRRAGAILDRYSQELERFEIDISNSAESLTGNATIKPVNRKNEQILGNLSAYSMDEVKSVANQTASLAGGGESGDKLRNEIITAKILKDELPKALRDAKGNDPSEVIGKLEEAFKTAGVDFSESLKTQLSENLQEKLTSRQNGGGLSDLQDDSGILDNLLKGREESVKFAQALQSKYNDTIQTAINLQAKYNDKVGQAEELQRKAASIRINAELELASALGRAPTLEELNQPFDNEVRDMTKGLVPGGTTDPAQIVAGMNAAQNNADSIQSRLDNVGTAYGGMDEKQRAEAIKNDIAALGKQKKALNDGSKALEKLANDGTKAANALSKIKDRQQLADNGRSLARRLLTSDGGELMDFNRQMSAYTKVITGKASPQELGNLQTRQDAFAGFDNIKSVLPEGIARRMEATLARKMIEANPKGQEILESSIGIDGADGKPMSVGDMLKNSEDGTDPAQEKYMKEYREATDAQVQATQILADRLLEGAKIYADGLAQTMGDAKAGIAGIVGQLEQILPRAQAEAQSAPEPEIQKEQPTNELKTEEASVNTIEIAGISQLDQTNKDVIQAIQSLITALGILSAAVVASSLLMKGGGFAGLFGKLLGGGKSAMDMSKLGGQVAPSLLQSGASQLVGGFTGGTAAFGSTGVVGGAATVAGAAYGGFAGFDWFNSTMELMNDFDGKVAELEERSRNQLGQSYWSQVSQNLQEPGDAMLSFFSSLDELTGNWVGSAVGAKNKINAQMQEAEKKLATMEEESKTKKVVVDEKTGLAKKVDRDANDPLRDLSLSEQTFARNEAKATAQIKVAEDIKKRGGTSADFAKAVGADPSDYRNKSLDDIINAQQADLEANAKYKVKERTKGNYLPNSITGAGKDTKKFDAAVEKQTEEYLQQYSQAEKKKTQPATDAKEVLPQATTESAAKPKNVSESKQSSTTDTLDKAQDNKPIYMAVLEKIASLLSNKGATSTQPTTSSFNASERAKFAALPQNTQNATVALDAQGKPVTAKQAVGGGLSSQATTIPELSDNLKRQESLSLSKEAAKSSLDNSKYKLRRIKDEEDSPEKQARVEKAEQEVTRRQAAFDRSANENRFNNNMVKGMTDPEGAQAAITKEDRMKHRAIQLGFMPGTNKKRLDELKNKSALTGEESEEYSRLDEARKFQEKFDMANPQAAMKTNLAARRAKLASLSNIPKDQRTDIQNDEMQELQSRFKKDNPEMAAKAEVARKRVEFQSLTSIPQNERTSEQKERIEELKAPLKAAAAEYQQSRQDKLASTPRGQMLAANKENYLADKKQKRQNFLSRFRPEVAANYMTDEEKETAKTQAVVAAGAQQSSQPSQTPTSGPIPTPVTTQSVANNRPPQVSNENQQAAGGTGGRYTITLDETSRQFLDTFSQTLNSFGGYVKDLANITIPDKVTISGAYTVDLKITGAAAIEALDKKIKEVGETLVSASDFSTALNELRDEVAKAMPTAVKSSAARGRTGSSQSGKPS